MSKARHCVCPSECFIQQHVEWGRRQPFLTANHVGHLHQVVIHDVSQVIGWQFVCTLIKHLVVKNRRVNLHFATNQVIHQHIASWLNLEADHILLAVGNTLFHFLFRHRQRVAHLSACACVILEILHFFTLLVQLFRRIECIVSLVCVQQHLHIFLVDVATLTLSIRSMISSKRNSLVKLDAQPLERLNDIFFRTRYKTSGVCVFDTENQISSMLLRKEVVVEGCAHTANMKRSCWTWCKTHPNLSFCHFVFFSFTICRLMDLPFSDEPVWTAKIMNNCELGVFS